VFVSAHQNRVCVFVEESQCIDPNGPMKIEKAKEACCGCGVGEGTCSGVVGDSITGFEPRNFYAEMDYYVEEKTEITYKRETRGAYIKKSA